MIGEFKYLYSYGYFYEEAKPKEGKYLQLPDGHKHIDRINAAEVAKISWDMCIFFYNNLPSEPYLTNNYNEKENARGIDFKEKIQYSVNIKTFEKTIVGPVS